MKQKDKICLITGANDGIGKATAKGIAEHGFTTVMVCRNSDKGKRALEEIQRQTRNPEIHLLIADLASKQQIYELSNKFKQNFSGLDVLINNAGVILPERKLTEDGFEYQFAVNHLAYFLLTNLLMDELIKRAPSRIVNVASGAHSGVRLDFDDLHSEKDYNPNEVYGKTKLANILFTKELARRLEGTGVTANCLTPGMVSTKMLDEYMGREDAGGVTPEEGAQTSIYLATSDDVKKTTGAYFSDCSETQPSKNTEDVEAARKLWDVSAKLTDLKETI